MEVLGKEDLPSVEEEHIGEHLNKLDIHKSMRFQVLRVTSRPLSVIFKRLWQLREPSEDWKQVNITPILKGGKKDYLENYKPVSLTLIPGTVMERLIWKSFPNSWRTRRSSKSRQHGFMKRKSWLTNRIAFYNEVTGSENKKRAVDIVCLDFSKAFNSLSHYILSDKMTKHR